MDSLKSNNSTRVINQDCFPVALEVHQQRLAVLLLWLTLAIIFGILIGVLLALIVFRFCCKRLWKNNLKSVKPLIGDKISINDNDKRPAVDEKDNSKNVPSTGGMCDIILKDNGNDASTEMMKQDISAATDFEDDLLAKRNLISDKLAVVHLNEKSQGTITDKEAVEKVLTEFRDRLTQIEQKLNSDFQANLELLKNDPELKSNQQKLQEEIQKLKAAHKRNLHVVFKNAVEDFREILRKNTNLTDKEIDDLVDKLKQSLTNLEVILNDHVDEQMQFLENNLANRTYLLDQVNESRQNVENKTNNYEEAANKILQKLVDERKINAQLKDSILKDFHESLQNVKNKHFASIKTDMEQQAEKLRKVRRERLERLKVLHKDQLAKLLKEAESMTDVEKFLKLTKELLDQQIEDMNEDKVDMDKEEAAKMNQIYLKFEQYYEEALQKQIAMFKDSLNTGAKLNTSDVDKLLREYAIDLKDMEKMREMERKLHLSTLREKLEERKRNVEQEASRKDSEQQRITKQQDNMLQKVLDGQRELDEKYFVKQDGTNEPATNEEELNEEKLKLTQELRDGLALETKVLMDQQDSSLAEVIGRLQVSQARRQVAIDRQDKLVKKLENELKQHTKTLTTDDVQHLDTILQDHRRQVEQLNNVLDNTRQKQLQNLQNKLEEKRIKSKKALEAKFEAEEEDILAKSLNNKMSFATSLLCQNKLTARHQRALEHLDSELKAESERQKEALNKDLQRELEKALLEQKKQFLGQLAALIKMTPEQIKSMVRHAPKTETQDNVGNISVLPETSKNSFPSTNRLPPIGKAPVSVGLGNVAETSGEVPLAGPYPQKRRNRKRRTHKHPQEQQQNDNDSDAV